MDCDDILSFIFISLSRSGERNIFDPAILWRSTVEHIADQGEKYQASNTVSSILQREIQCGSCQWDKNQFKLSEFVTIFNGFQGFGPEMDLILVQQNKRSLGWWN